MVVNQVLLLLLKPQPYVPAKTFATNCMQANRVKQMVPLPRGGEAISSLFTPCLQSIVKMEQLLLCCACE